MSEVWKGIGIELLVWSLILSMPIGLGLAFWFDTPQWLFLFLAGFIFLMAG